MYKHPCAVMWKQGLEGADGEAGQGLEGVGRGRLQGPETGCGGGKGIPCWAWALEGRSFLKEALPHAEVGGDGAQRRAWSGYITPRRPSATQGARAGRRLAELVLGLVRLMDLNLLWDEPRWRTRASSQS